MPSVLILSDSHGLTEDIQQITNRHQVDYAVHCGDSELDMDAPVLAEFLKVKGNCDFDVRFPDEQLAEIEDLSLFVTHGHLYQVKRNLMTLSYKAEEEGANVVCFGHTHIAGAEKIGNQLFINPGSIRLPRNRPEKTYAILEWNNKNDVTVHFYTVNGVIIDELSYQTLF